MPRYIDADMLRQRMYHEAFETDTDMQKWDSGCWIRYKLFENCIDEMPTISPDEVRGVASWIPHGDCGVTECSACKWSIEEYVEYNYCPNCGARMEGAETSE